MLWLFPHEEFKFESRYRHWLASRVLLQEVLGDRLERKETQLLKHPNGKPYIPGINCNISLSHSGEYAAAMVSQSGNVGVDIEEITPRIQKIARKFINDYEWDYLVGENDLHTMYLLWAAKEAVFKWYGLGSVDFKQHIKVLLPQKEGEGFVNAILSKDGETSLKIYTEVVDNKYRLSWVGTDC